MEEMGTLPGHRQTREMSLEQGLLITALLLYTTSVQTGRVPTHRQGQGLEPHVREESIHANKTQEMHLRYRNRTTVQPLSGSP